MTATKTKGTEGWIAPEAYHRKKLVTTYSDGDRL